MKNKAQRLQIIKDLIKAEAISSQDELLVRLKKIGIEATQSTLSRDLKLIKVAKIPDDTKGYIYAINENHIDIDKIGNSASNIVNTILSIDFSHNNAVIKTLPGYANAVTVLIDKTNHKEILGTIAGDDTILIIMREDVTPKKLLSILSTIYPNINLLNKQNYDEYI